MIPEPHNTFDTPHTLEPTIPLERSVANLIATLSRIVELTVTPVLWPAEGTEPVDAGERELRRQWSREIEGHFHNMRRRASEKCPSSLLPMYEAKLDEIEATTRAAVTARLSPFLVMEDHIEDIERFKKKWVPYLESSSAPPRVRCEEHDHSVWLDGKCLVTGLTTEVFAYIKALVKAYPNTLPWRVATHSIPGFRGKNQSRFKKALPSPLRKLIEARGTGSVLKLPNLSTSVSAA